MTADRITKLFRPAASSVASFLEIWLQKLCEDWWEKRIISRLSPQQQRVAEEKRITELRGFDFSALLRIADQNWNDIAISARLPRDSRNLIKELISARNRLVHANLEDLSASDAYRDADTFMRFMMVIGADEITLNALRQVRDEALRAMNTDLGGAGRPNEGGAVITKGVAAPAPPIATTTANALSVAGAPRQADRIRTFVMTKYVEPARSRGAIGFTIRSGDVHKQMGIVRAYPAVCSAIDSLKFLELTGVRLISRTGPVNGSTVEWTFHFK